MVVYILTTRLLEHKGWQYFLQFVRSILSTVLLAMSTSLYSSHYVSDNVNSQCILPEMLHNLQCVCADRKEETSLLQQSHTCNRSLLECMKWRTGSTTAYAVSLTLFYTLVIEQVNVGLTFVVTVGLKRIKTRKPVIMATKVFMPSGAPTRLLNH